MDPARRREISSISSRNAAAHLLKCLIINTGPHYLIIGERLLITESNVVTQISRLNQELINLARGRQQKNPALKDLVESKRRSEAEKKLPTGRLQEALQQVKTLSELLPICSA